MFFIRAMVRTFSFRGQGRSLAVQPDCLKGRVVCGTVYGEMHLKNLLGSFVRVGYRIPFPDSI